MKGRRINLVKSKKTSVVVAVYNGERYLLEQLESIRQQTFVVDEVILCDDRSTDRSAEIIRNFIDQYQLDAKWSLYINDKNLGYADNFHLAVLKAKGEVIFFCDQDDIWINTRIEEMVHIMNVNPRIQLLGSEYIPFYESEDAPVVKDKALTKMTGDHLVELIKLNNRTIFIGCEGCTMCMRRSFIQRVAPLWLMGLPHDEYVWKMALCEEGCYIYHAPTLKRRFHSGNVSKHKMRDKEKRILFLQKLLVSHQQMLLYAEERKLPIHDRKLIQKNITSVKLRIGMLKDKKILNSIRLILSYSRYFHSRKSIPVEFIMAIR